MRLPGSGLARDVALCGACLCAASAAWAQTTEFGPPIVLTNSFNVPAGLGLDTAHGRLLIADTGNHRVKHAAISSLAGTPTWSELGYTASRSDFAALNEPQGVATDASGNVFVVNTFANDVNLYRYSAGSYSFDSSFASTTRTSVAGLAISRPRDIAVGPDGKIYLLDSGNKRILQATDASATAWTVWRTDTSWGNPYGLDVAADGTVYVADTDNHRIVKIPTSGSPVSFGAYGTGSGQLRSPRDVAVAADGKMFIADTDNHRVVILRPDGTHYATLALAPLVGTPQKVIVDASNHIFVVDSQLNTVIAFLGPGTAQPFDLYVRDFLGDDGTQPSSSSFFLQSPDLLVRHHPDIDLTAAATAGLESYFFEQPDWERTNYVYVGVRNRGAHLAPGSTVRLYWADPGSALAFPANWKTDGFYSSYASSSSNTPSNSLTVPTVTNQAAGADGKVVVGPILWRPPRPDIVMAHDGKVDLFARILTPADPTQTAAGLNQVRINNNVALRPVEVQRGPFPIGDQNTLVVRANFHSTASDNIDEATLHPMVNGMAQWIHEVSYGLATVRPVYFPDAIVLDHDRPYYSSGEQSMIIDMTTEAINKVLALQPTVLDGPTSDPSDDIDRVIVVVNDPTFQLDYATPGNWPFIVGSSPPLYLSCSVQGPTNSFMQFAHAMGHQLGLEDLYIYDHIVFPRVHVADPWDNMAAPSPLASPSPFNGAHPVTWNKQLANWVTSSGGKIFYIPRPPYTSPRTGQPAIPLSYQSILQSGQWGAIAIGLSEHVTAFDQETQFYWVEARSQALGNADSVLPQDGVLMYYANKLIPEGQGPVIVRDHTFGDDNLTNALLGVGDHESPAGTGLTVTVQSAIASHGGYNIAIDYAPPADDYDVWMEPGAPTWESPDIWAAVQPYPATPTPGADQPRGGEDNRIYARVRNLGPGTAYDIEVRFLISAPYHTVGDEASFDLYKIVLVDHINPGQYVDTYVIWHPAPVGDPHNCVKVQLRNLVSDNNAANNGAQKNFSVQNATHASPYTAQRFDFQVKNPLPQPTLVYFRADGVPKAWTRSLTPLKKQLAVDQTFTGRLDYKPDDDAPDCTDHDMQVTAWVPRGDTLVRLGGTHVRAQLREQTLLRTSGKVAQCDGQLFEARQPYVERAVDEYRKFWAQFPPVTAATYEKTSVQVERPCKALVVNGCTAPSRPNEHLLVRYKDPAGNPVYHDVVTDAFGCYDDMYLAVEGGPWTITTLYKGSQCAGAAQSGFTAEVPLQMTGDQDHDGVPDKAEIDGDADGDGIPNFLDIDSDNDGVPDGQEPPGDADHDGVDNIVDRDSNNDGTPDGQDPFPYQVRRRHGISSPRCGSGAPHRREHTERHCPRRHHGIPGNGRASGGRRGRIGALPRHVRPRPGAGRPVRSGHRGGQLLRKAAELGRCRSGGRTTTARAIGSSASPISKHRDGGTRAWSHRFGEHRSPGFDRTLSSFSARGGRLLTITGRYREQPVAGRAPRARLGTEPGQRTANGVRRSKGRRRHGDRPRPTSQGAAREAMISRVP